MNVAESRPPQGALRGLLGALRVPQWVKNGFLFAPLVFAGKFTDAALVLRLGLGFVAFSLVTSAVYLLNDLADAPADREHPRKRTRPIASGAVPATLASVAAGMLLVAGLAGAYALAPAFAGLVAAYFGINVLYTWRLKHVVIVDVFCIASGFVLRVEAGARLAGVPASTWLLVCTSMLALFLGFSKRRHEVLAQAAASRKVLDDYSPQFLDKMMNLAEAVTVVAYLMYAVAPETEARYGRGMLLTVPFVLYGVFRYQYLVYHRQTAENPTDAFLTDRPLLGAVALWVAVAAAVVLGAQ
jgi:4-hydroxybenzoate polyprenyltransferase